MKVKMEVEVDLDAEMPFEEACSELLRQLVVCVFHGNQQAAASTLRVGRGKIRRRMGDSTWVRPSRGSPLRSNPTPPTPPRRPGTCAEGEAVS
jgi:hypothetical protein